MRSQSIWDNQIFKTLIIIIIVVVVLGAGSLGLGKFKNSDQNVNSAGFQAIFLANGQTYFGKMSAVNGPYIKITNVYYLQVQQAVQPDEKKKVDDSKQEFTLTKLGNELHGPEDAMYVSRDQVLFWENLKDNGKVVQAIKTNK